ncbi:hypothetical protein [Acinetobacter sp. Marseille-Q1618]|uniref:hypothetical protein n=1 Tax=Acinetobacter sp. Marseille-Q1618 TaxID=2697502 RepID=UPI00156D8F43|nr:hypothetical protein [Acinetobacter sp. Marseille-Q1618]
MTEFKIKTFKILFEILINDPTQNRAYDCLKFLCETTLSKIQQDTVEPITFTRYQLKSAVDGKSSADKIDPKALGKWINDQRLNSLMGIIIQKYEKQFEDIGYFPTVKTNDTVGGKGNERFYWLDIIEAVNIQNNDEITEIKNIAYYERTDPAEIKLSWLYKFIFKKGEMKNKSLRGLAMIIILFGSIIFWAIYVCAFSLVLANKGQGFSSLDLLFILCLYFFSYIMFKFWAIPLWSLPEHRVIKAPMSFMSLNEDFVDIEMYKDNNKNQITRVTKFKAICPICSSDIILKSGKPDQRAPLVGRCVESPFAHVYSFDRVTMKGLPLN